MVYNLEVNGNTKIIGDIRFSGDLYKNNVLFTGGSDWIKTGNNISYNAGNVGIGNTNPLYQLSLGTHLINGGDGKLYIGKNSGGGSARFFTIKYNSGYDMCFSDSDNKEIFKVSHAAPINSLVVIGNGNVGIGNNNPSHKLTVNGNTLLNGPLHIIEGSGTTAGANSGSIIIDHENNGGASSITFRSRANRGSDFAYIQYQDASSVGAGGESARLIIGTQNDADDHIILNPGLGNVGIGNDNPFQKLTVSGNINATGNITSTSMNPGTLFMGDNRWHNGAGREVFYFGTDGRNYYRGSNNIPHTWRRGDDNNIMSLTDGGNLRANGSFTTVSDERIKKDIEDIDDEDSLNKILLVQCKKYKYIDETKGTNFVTGFIAQQIKEIIPEAVHIATEPQNEGDEIQDFHYLDKMMIYTHNVSATQELHRIIMRQQTVIDSLISRIEALEGA